MKTTEKPANDTLNGMPHYGEVGTGEVNGATIVWSVDVLGAKKPLIILTFAAPTLLQRTPTPTRNCYPVSRKPVEIGGSRAGAERWAWTEGGSALLCASWRLCDLA